jgi:MFS family permease
LAIWIPAASNTALILYSIFFGFFSGAYVSLGPALVAQISSTAEIGYRTGIFFFVSSFGGLTTGPIAGAITAHSGGNYLGMKIYSGIFCLAGTTLVLAARLYETGPKLAARF